MPYQCKKNPKTNGNHAVKVLWATSIYPTPMFDIFLKDHLETINNQTHRDFDLLLFLDCISQDTIKKEVRKYANLQKIKIHYLAQKTNILNPMEIRQKLLSFAYDWGYELLILSDFDETMDANRFEETIKQIGDFDFSFSSFYIVDSRLQKLEDEDFHKKCKTPKMVLDIFPVLDKNFIGLGNMSIKINNPLFSTIKNLKLNNCYAFDWLIATFMILNGLKGIRIDDTFVNYRQHQDSYTGIFKPLSTKTLDLGVRVKKMHYNFFRKSHTLFDVKHQEIIELEKYLLKNKDNYIKIINQHYNPTMLCWWENIKTLQEVKQWI